jgi:hypothetical protein
MANATAELVSAEAVVEELRVSLKKRSCLWYDNLGATYLSRNRILHAQTKHIEINYRIVCERVARKLLNIRFISNKDQVANGFTKTLPAKALDEFERNLNLSQALD